MTVQKRAFDILFGVVLLAVLWPLILGVAVCILVQEGRPVFYISERMKTPHQGFALFKFRTMSVSDKDSGVSGGDKSSRVTRLGKLLRKARLDELPQLWNILRGDMSFVGPRPPLRQYVERFPDIYADVLQSRPGVTGLASLIYHRHEEMLLEPCKTLEETDRVYCQRCVPQKARLDMIYQENANICFDALLMLRTLGVALSKHR